MTAILRRWWWLPPLALLLVIAWGTALFGPFHYDDDLVIVHYPPVHSLAAWWDSLPGLRPLLKLSYTLNWIADPRPFGFHLVNLLLHALNGVLALAWLRRVLPVYAQRAAGWVVVLWLLHPVTTEAVTYVSGRSVSLAATFTLAALWVAAGDTRRAPWLAALCAALALAVRETSWAIPAALFLVAWLRGCGARAAFALAWPSALVVLLAAAAFLVEPHHRRLLDVAFAERDLAAQLLAQLEAYRWFAGQMLLLSAPNFDPDLRVPEALTPALAMQALLMLALVLFAAWRVVKARSLPAGAFLLALFFLLPGNGVVPRLDVANDRHLYLPALCVLLAFAAWLARLEVTAAVRAALATLVLLFAAGTALRNLDYLDAVSLWQRTAAQSPGKSRVWNNLGIACRDAGDLACAEEAFRYAVTLDPDNLRARANLYFLRR